jgi:glutaredoxin
VRLAPFLAPWLLSASCTTEPAISPAEVDRIHGICTRHIAAGNPLTHRRGDVGTLPGGSKPRDRVVIYGASWCGACHIAADYLRRLGIPFVELDIEKDARALEELHGVLERASLPRGRGLPVVEVRGTVMLGFMPCVVEAVWRG